MSRGVWYRWQATEDATAIDPDYQTLALEWRDDLTAQDIRSLGLARDKHRPPQESAIRTVGPQAYMMMIAKAKASIEQWNHEQHVAALASQLTEAHIRAAAKRVAEWQERNWRSLPTTR